ncbi:MFS general substrate transporter [Wolfiporia cocos MD-104 SS10]|uniref:MFS general substrate transporter n=1 Tax=Wolfiporia cocos (strain MD-104) TaxID=742152 RepID=A0A2H3JLY7_WOLCO|nr:MFS general substrate transporter [Wolfiporia cocos MD-104 SS10]
MEAPKFWMMSLGRIFEGISSAIIMTAGLALICDTTPEAEIGGQLGIAMVGLPFGGLFMDRSLLGPPVGGALYDRWGYRAPFIFAILFTLIDLSGRLLVIEGDDKSRMSNRDTEASSESPDSFQNEDQQPRGPIAEKSYAEPSHTTATAIVEEKGTIQEQGDNSKNQPAFQIILRFLSTPRILVGLVVCFFCSFVFSAADVTLPLRLQAVWGLNSRKVGLIYLAAIVPTMIYFFVAAVASPITTEFAAVTRGMRGVGYAHTYGTFNVVMGLGNCAGSIIGGQIYAHLHDAWHKLCFVYIGVLARSARDPALMIFIKQARVLGLGNQWSHIQAGAPIEIRLLNSRQPCIMHYACQADPFDVPPASYELSSNIIAMSGPAMRYHAESGVQLLKLERHALKQGAATGLVVLPHGANITDAPAQLASTVLRNGNLED